MKLIYIANARIPTEKAHGIQIMKMCEAFSLAGNEVRLVVSRRFNKIKDDPFDYYGVKKVFKITKLPCLDFIPLDKYLGNLALWIQSVSFFFFLFQHILFKKADIIYSRDQFSFPLGLFKKNLFFEAHSFPENYFLYLPFFKRLKGIIVITQKLKDLFVEKGIPENKILVAPDGVDLEGFDIKENQEDCRNKLNLPLDKKIVGYVGRLETTGKEKGMDILLKAFKILKEKSPEVLLCIVGGPKERIIQYQDFSRKIGLEKRDNIIFTGQVSHKLIPKYLKSLDVLVLPFPRTRHYAFHASPLKIFEYMASKRPVVVSDLPSIREILNENNAVLVEPDDHESLAKGIKKALESSNLAEKISNQAFQDVQDYTWQKRVERILNFIKIL